MTGAPSNWWSRNWKWVVPCGCLVLVALAAAGAGGFVWLLKSAMTSSDAYRLAVDRAVRHPAAVEALGAPVEPGWWVSGSVQTTGPSGTADIAVPIRGPKASGTLYAVAAKSAGEWSFERLELEVEGRRIDLLETVGPEGADADAAAGESPPAAPPPSP